MPRNTTSLISPCCRATVQEYDCPRCHDVYECDVCKTVYDADGLIEKASHASYYSGPGRHAGTRAECTICLNDNAAERGRTPPPH